MRQHQTGSGLKHSQEWVPKKPAHRLVPQVLHGCTAPPWPRCSKGPHTVHRAVAAPRMPHCSKAPVRVSPDHTISPRELECQKDGVF